MRWLSWARLGIMQSASDSTAGIKVIYSTQHWELNAGVDWMTNRAKTWEACGPVNHALLIRKRPVKALSIDHRVKESKHVKLKMG